jgi:hypothetical protein
LRFPFISRFREGEIECVGIFSKVGIGPRPETLSEASAYGFDEGLVWMGFKQIFKTVNENRGDDIEKVGIFLYGFGDYRVGEF